MTPINDTIDANRDAELNREILRFSYLALELAKKTVDSVITVDEEASARELAMQLPEYAARARELAETYRAGAMRALADARLDFAFVAAGGGIPSSIRLGHYISDREANAGA